MKHCHPTSMFTSLFKEKIVLRRVITSIMILGVALVTAHGANAEVVKVITGNGAGQGTVDTEVTYTAKSAPNTGPFGSPFVAADFAAARNGSSAHNLGTTLNGIAGINPLWKPQLDGSSASWISNHVHGGNTSFGSTSLYAQKFNLTGADGLANVTLKFDFLIDDALGGPANVGLFIGQPPMPGDGSGTGIPGSVLASAASNYQGPDKSFTANVTGLVTAGDNWLYVYTVNDQGPSGVQWDATITAVPEPTSFALFGLAMVGFARRRRR